LIEDVKEYGGKEKFSQPGEMKPRETPEPRRGSPRFNCGWLRDILRTGPMDGVMVLRLADQMGHSVEDALAAADALQVVKTEAGGRQAWRLREPVD
jgi:hypothetical protein